MDIYENKWMIQERKGWDEGEDKFVPITDVGHSVCANSMWDLFTCA